MGHDDDLFISKLVALYLIFHDVFSFPAFGRAQNAKRAGRFNDRLAQWLMVCGDYMFACPDALNDLFTSFRGWGLCFHMYGKTILGRHYPFLSDIFVMEILVIE